ncbi:laccase domain-containing protein [Leptospira congkakensis]|uniref:Laccase domain-containing protein n=1 Tax=Leptospira congkakensis TaxID=2484932 RepID=A0A4Z1AFZ3_9LEPT|nr:polyphenol oxidase family protein [Leptospira congkakensis]TGL87328.1 laccase domain-containing protein [Leptospira congkakensis]TGL96894.1 laccase domain-containing protein [Leptospira congkakensis]TGL97746.1 laccase domain-containing protein [Leptospira congkakensis]
MEYNREITVSYGKVKFGTAGKQDLDGLKEVYPVFSKTPEIWKEYTTVWANKEFENIPHKICTLNQVHGDFLHQISSVAPDSNPDLILTGDGLYTNLPNRLLVVRTADCVPIFLYSDKQPFVAMIHSGWKGTNLGITEQMLDTVIQLGYTEEELHLEIGPYIQGRDYEVGEDVAILFQDLGDKVCFPNGNGKFQLDVGLAIEARVKVRFPNLSEIRNSHTNVFQSPLYFSHRAKEEGRNLNFILWES